jgi:hypothetical protein
MKPNLACRALLALPFITAVMSCANSVPRNDIRGFGVYQGAASPLANKERLVVQKSALRSLAICMKRSGFEYKTADPAKIVVSDIDFSKRSSRLEFGYGINTRPSDRPLEPPPDPNRQLTGAMSELELRAYNIALLGHVPTKGKIVKTSGCLGPYSDEVFQLQNSSEVEHSRSLAKLFLLSKSAKWTNLDQTWAECMKTKHFLFTSPSQARLSFSKRIKTPENATEEKEVAIADFDCDQPLLGARQELFSAAQ